MPESTGLGRGSSAVATGLLVAGAVIACLPWTPAAGALAGGVALALTTGNPHVALTRTWARKLLPISVVGLGAAMDLAVVARTGARGIGYTVATIGACVAIGTFLGKALRVPRRTGTLVTIGTAICGGSAIAAAAPVIGADDQEISVALGTVFVLNGIALLVFPPIGHAAALPPSSFGLWAALAIHDTSSVVGAALQYGAAALSIGTTVKLARALWIVPVTLVLAALERRRRAGAASGPSRPPWFILGFVAAAALTTYLPALRPTGEIVAALARRSLVLTLYLIGVGLSRETLRAVGVRPLVLGVALWIAMGVGTLAAIHAGLLAV